MKKITIVILLFSHWWTINAQSTISGKVIANDETPLAFASVLLMNANDSSFIRGTITDDNGDYIFQKIEGGNYFLNISMMGYQDQNIETFRATDENISLTTTLSENSEVLEEITVTAKRPLFEQQIDRTVVNVQSSIATKGSNALEILSRSPGIEIDRVNSLLNMFGKDGVIVMLNGKRMRMDGDGLIQLLQSLPADNIEKIELITAPPASFDAEGNAGFINIVTVKNSNEGFNGNLNLNAGYGIRHKLGGSTNWNIRKKNVNIFADFSGSYNDTQENNTFSRTNTFEGKTTISEIFGNRPAIIELYNGRIGMDVDITDRTTIGVLASGYLSKWTMDANTTTLISDNIDGNSRAELNAFEINDWVHWMSNINFRHTFQDKSNLSFDIDYLSYYDNNPTQYVDRIFHSSQILTTEENFSSYKRTPINFWVSKADYKKKISDDITVEVGVKGTRSQFINDVGVERLNNGEWIIDDRFTDVFEMNEQIGAMYFSSNYKINDKISAKAGLRYEYYNSQIESEANANPLVSFQFGRLFPTAYLSYNISSEKQLQFSYNERIMRPQINHLAPAFFFWDNNTILAGNPGVKPTISRNATINYRHKTIAFTANFTDNDNPFTFQPTIDAEENIMYSRAENMEDMKTAMLAVNIPYTITDWWESRYNISGYWLHTKPVFEGILFSQNSYYTTINMAQNFTLKNDFGIEFSGNYRSPLTWGLGYVPQNISFNLGIQKKFKNEMQLSLTWNDMFDLGTFWSINYNQPELNIVYDFFYETEGNVFRLNFSWNFGNSKLKKGGNRQTGSSEERQRVN